MSIYQVDYGAFTNIECFYIFEELKRKNNTFFTEIQQTSSLKSSVNEKQNFEKTKIAADNMSSIVKKSPKDKIFVSSSLWRNTTKTKTPKPQLRTPPIEISTGISTFITNYKNI